MKPLRASLTALLLFAMSACGRADAVDWKDCPGSTWLGAAPASLPGCVAQAGADATDTIQAGIGDSVEDIRANSSFPLTFDNSFMFFTDTTVDVEWRDGAQSFLFDDVGGTGQAVLILSIMDDQHLYSMQFAWQNRPLTLRETVERAKRLEVWLDAAGFAAPAEGNALRPSFVALNEFHASTEQVFGDWASAEAALSSESVNVQEMRLYARTNTTTLVTVTAKNMRRAALNFDARAGIEGVPGIRRTVFDGNGGHEWLLEVRISSTQPYTFSDAP